MANDNKKQPEATQEQKPSEKPMSEVVSEAIKEGLSMGIMAAGQLNKPAAKPAPRDTCGVCRQPNMACKGEHIGMVVLPADPEDASWFQGAKINGVAYRSMHHGHQIAVPKENDIPRMIQDFELSERRARRGRKFEHNSGSIGGQNATGYVPAPVDLGN